jgi:hypothetical protein
LKQELYLTFLREGTTEEPKYESGGVKTGYSFNQLEDSLKRSFKIESDRQKANEKDKTS